MFLSPKIPLGLFTVSVLIIAVIYFNTEPQKPEDILIVGTNTAFPPFEFLNSSGELEGFDIDLAHLIAKKMNKKLVLKDMAFDALILELQQGKIDLAISGISITEKRKQEVHLVHYHGTPTQTLTLAFWNNVPTGITKLEDLAEIDDLVVCVQSGNVQAEILEKMPFIKVKHLENIQDLVMDIKFGKSTAAALEPAIVKGLNKKDGAIKPLTLSLSHECQDLGDGIGINKHNATLIKQVEEMIAEWKADGTIDGLTSHWFKK